MTIAACVATALHLDLDIIEAFPEVQSLAIEEMEPRIDRFLDDLHECLSRAIAERGLPYLKSADSAGLCAVLLPRVRLPLPMLLRLCRTITELWHEGDCCAPIYFVRMTVPFC